MHGAWHDGSCWDPLVRALAARGHDAVAPDLPLFDPNSGYDERARPALEATEGVRDRIVVVGHSMGSAYAPLVAAASPGSLLVYLCGGWGPLREGFPFPARRPDGTRVWDRDEASAALYPRLPPETAAELAARLRPMAPAPGDSPWKEGLPDVPSVAVYASDDELFDAASEREIARRQLGSEPVEIPGGHFPMAEDPEGLAAVLDRLERSTRS